MRKNSIRFLPSDLGFERRADYLGYAERLALGQSIGSGLVEGACKQVIGRRMKQTGARWRVRRANRMATLCGTFHGDPWTPYWDHLLHGLPESAHAPHTQVPRFFLACGGPLLYHYYAGTVNLFNLFHLPLEATGSL